MRFQDPLDGILRTKSHIRLLRELCRLPTGYGVSAREMARRSGISHPTASSVLTALTDEGLTRRQRAVRADSYKLNRDHVMTQGILSLFAWEESLRSELLSFLKAGLSGLSPTHKAFLFGSAARGEATGTSDIDLAVIGPDDDSLEAVIEGVSEAVHQRFGNRLNVLYGSPKDIRSGARGQPRAVWRQVVEDGIRII